GRAVAGMSRHVDRGGVLIVEPWFTPDNWQAGRPFIHTGEIGAALVCRMSVSAREANRSILNFQYLRSTLDGIEHYSERLELGLFARDEMTHAFEAAAMK